MAVMFLDIGRGLIAVNHPKTRADTNEREEFVYRLLRSSSLSAATFSRSFEEWALQAERETATNNINV